MKKRTEFETGRFAAISDGIFAIAITLLVLDLNPPDDLNFIGALKWVLPKLETWALSFMIIGALWVMQHNIFAQLRACDTPLLYFNLFFLMCISLMPWTTSLIGQYTEEPLAIVIFSGLIGLAGLILLGAWIYAFRKKRLTTARVTDSLGYSITLLAMRIPLIALISISLAYVHRTLALWIWGLISVFGKLIRQRIKEPETRVGN